MSAYNHIFISLDRVALLIEMKHETFHRVSNKLKALEERERERENEKVYANDYILTSSINDICKSLINNKMRCVKL